MTFTGAWRWRWWSGGDDGGGDDGGGVGFVVGDVVVSSGIDGVCGSVDDEYDERHVVGE